MVEYYGIIYLIIGYKYENWNIHKILCIGILGSEHPKKSNNITN